VKETKLTSIEWRRTENGEQCTTTANGDGERRGRMANGEGVVRVRDLCSAFYFLSVASAVLLICFLFFFSVFFFLKKTTSFWRKTKGKKKIKPAV
jgi:hypothetical protein